MRIKVYILIAIMVVVVGTFFVWNWKFRVSADAKEFIGKVEKIENNTIYAQGTFVVPDKPEFSNSDQIRSVKILTSPETKFLKTLVFLPSEAELKKTGGYFDGKKLKRENREVSLETMSKELERRDIVVQIKANENIFRKPKFLAAEVGYTVQFIEEIDGRK